MSVGWIALLELPPALFGFWMAHALLRHMIREGLSGYREAQCAQKGGHALKATRWYVCRSCGYEATPEEVRAEIAREEAAGGTKFVILKPMGGDG